MAHPRMYDDHNPLIQRLRELCSELPDTFEKEAWGECTFRVKGGGMFAMTDNDHHSSGHVAVWLKATKDEQEILVQVDPSRFFVPPYVGAKGWVGVRLDDKTNWPELAEMLADAHALAAPQRRRRVARDSAAVASKDATSGKAATRTSPGQRKKTRS